MERVGRGKLSANSDESDHIRCPLMIGAFIQYDLLPGQDVRNTISEIILDDLRCEEHRFFPRTAGGMEQLSGGESFYYNDAAWFHKREHPAVEHVPLIGRHMDETQCQCIE